MRRLKNFKNESGAIIIESIIALTVYIFAIFTILSIVDVCYTQARVSIALNSAARDLSKYSYLYFKFGGAQFQADVAAGAGDSEQMTKDIIIGSGNFVNELTGLTDVTDLASLEAQLDFLDQSGGELQASLDTMSDAYAEDPSGFMKAMGLMALNDGIDNIKDYIGQSMGRAFMKKNLVAFEGDDADAFLKRHGIKDGLDGLMFEGTSFMPDGTGDIALSVVYDIEVIKLLDIDVTVRIWQTAKTTAWGEGVHNEATPDE